MSDEAPSFKLLGEIVAPRIVSAIGIASRALTRAKVRHALIGGLAVGAYGYARSTRDIDFLIGEEGYKELEGDIVTFALGVPIEVHEVPIELQSDELLEEELEQPIEADGIPIVSLEALVYLKLRSHRRRDREDVVELLRVGYDEGPIRDYLSELAPDLVDRFEGLVEAADAVE